MVNDSGYEIMSSLDLENKTVLEFGPGNLRHYKFWNGTLRNILSLRRGHDECFKEIFESERFLTNLISLEETRIFP